MSKFQLTCTLTSYDRKFLAHLQYTEMLTPNAIKTSSRKKSLHKITQFCVLNHEEYNRQKRKKSDNWNISGKFSFLSSSTICHLFLHIYMTRGLGCCLFLILTFIHWWIFHTLFHTWNLFLINRNLVFIVNTKEFWCTKFFFQQSMIFNGPFIS